MAELLTQFVDRGKVQTDFDWIDSHLNKVEDRLTNINAKGVKLEVTFKNSDGKDLASMLETVRQLNKSNEDLVTGLKQYDTVRKTVTATNKQAERQEQANKKTADDAIASIRKDQEELKKLADAYDKKAAAKKRADDSRGAKEAARAEAAQSAARIKQLKDEAKETERLEKIRQKDIKSIEKEKDEYTSLNAEHLKLLANAKNAGVVFGLESETFKKASAEANKLGQRLYEIDVSLGNHRRNVGNYASAWSGLGNSVNQLAREAPAFAVSMQTGFLAISNNLPILYDELSKIKAENAALIAQGKPHVSMWKQVGNAVFSLNTAISIGITLLTLYGKDIVDFLFNTGAGMVKASDGTKVFTERTKILSEVFKEAATTYSKTAAEIAILKDRFFDSTATVKDKTDVMNTLNEKYGDTIGKLKGINDAEEFFVKRSEAFIESLRLRAEIEGAYGVIAKNTETLLKQQAETVDDNVSSWQKFSKFNQTLFSGKGMSALGKGFGDLFKGKKIGDYFGDIFKEELNWQALLNNVGLENAVNRSNSVAEEFAKAQQRRLTELKKQFGFSEGNNETKGKGISDTYNLEKRLKDDIAKADADRAKRALETDKKLQQDIFTNETRSLDERVRARWRFHSDILGILELERKEQVDQAENEHKATLKQIDDLNVSSARKVELRELEESRHTKNLATIQETYQQEALQSQNKYADDSIADIEKYNKKAEEEELKSMQRRFEGWAIYWANIKKGIREAAEAEAEDLKKRQGAYVSVFNSFSDIGKTIGDATYDKRLQKIDREKTALEDRYKMELAYIDATSKTEIEATQRKGEAAGRYEADRINAERQQRAVQRQKAIFDKAVSIQQIITGTAIAVINALGAKPYTPANIALAAAAGATGASQLAAAIAAPIPEFYKGTKFSPEGFAHVGERGSEMRVNPDGSIELTPSKDTVTYLERGTTIVPHEQTREILNNLSVSNMNTVLGHDQNRRTDMLLARTFAEVSERSSKKIVDAIRGKNVIERSNNSAFFADYYHNKFKN